MNGQTETSVFRRLLLWMAITGILIALLSSAVHHVFASTGAGPTTVAVVVGALLLALLVAWRAADHIVHPAMELTQTLRERAKAGVANREALFKQAAKLANIGHWVWDETNDCAVEVSDEYARIMGFEPHEFLQHVSTIEDELALIHPEDRSLYRRHYEESKRRPEQGFEVEFRIVTPGGEIRHVHEIGELVSDADGRSVRTVGTLQDITERKRHGEALRSSEERLAKIYESANDGIVVIDPDSETIVEANPRAAAMLDFPAAELAGMGLDQIHPYDMKAFRSFAREVVVKGTGYIDELSFQTSAYVVVPVGLSASSIELEGRTLIMVMVRDITERRRNERALRESEQRFRALYDDNPSMFFTLADDATILSVNHYCAEHLAYSTEALVGSRWRDLHFEEDWPLLDELIGECLSVPGEVKRWEIRKIRADGEIIQVRETARAVRNLGGGTTVLSVCEDITEAHRLSQQLSFQAKHDALTGLVNRREFEERLNHALQAAAVDDTRSALCYLDLDQFKVINDTCGHVAGDELLRDLGHVISEHVRKSDTLARLGGDEFGLLLEDCSLDKARVIADTLRRTIEEFQFAWDDKLFNVGVSIGMVPITTTSGSLAATMSAADNACYRAKEQGRNRIHVYHEDDAELAQRYREVQWLSRINQALDADRFELWYQSIVPVRPRDDAAGQGEMQHYEVLVRMIDDDGRTVPPGAFLPAAERYGLSPRIDRWVIEHTLDWLSRHPVHLAALEMCSINLSGLSLGEPEFAAFVTDAIRASSVPPRKLCFEITETAAIGNLSTASQFIRNMRALGCRFALDDFGSGLSSFAYLKNLPVDFLKIDGMFVKDIVEDAIDRSMVKSINDIGQVMGKQTIAEFVENEQILRELAKIGVDFAQGYGVERPKALKDSLPLRQAV